MAEITIIATTSGTLSEKTDLYNSVRRKLTVITANDGSAKLRVIIGKDELNNGAKINGLAAALPDYKDYPDFTAFLKDWTSIEADPMQVRRY